MSSYSPLHDSELIDCARANGNKGIAIAAQRCGYGNDLATFEQKLKKASKGIGIDIQGFDELINISQKEGKEPGIVVAPETPTQL
jgi:hypothetical protein